ncbi:hypothetical protein [Aurantiacibacter gangjinensis]|uniref:Uncharacterized protein n=1 Tax=Aurantiacibacter gangjinensis TaxID=502682 RepID=A0A0G9MM13_9SPHN|nr:hypothetical protein [Aurantiacibacter gangjinensis]APE27727.1 hypothetical protein BMF35_a0898 [Aurantiacibacter gangjinensis]KLE31730.1 hypothetical protein AAW01_09480 [Aurantiacibacter gangjinensis]
MMTKRSALLAGLGGICLQGCVAAAAIPVIAGAGSIVRSGVSGDDEAQAPEGTVIVAQPPAQAPSSDVPETAASAPYLATSAPAEAADAPTTPVAAAPPPAEPAVLTPPPAQEPIAQTRAASPAISEVEAAAQEALASIRAAEAERVSGMAPVPSAAATTGAQSDSTYAAIRSYTLQTLAGGIPLPSAQLADPSSLEPVRRECAGDPPTIVIDLDPAGDLAPISGPIAVNTGLGRVLAEMRARGVTIAWVTNRGAMDARAIRDRLVASGLDPEARDVVYVERYPGESKQSRRDTLAQNHCIIAMAGDERSDFDDLYNYLRDESGAQSLEPMLGAGWFLIDNPVGQ